MQNPATKHTNLSSPATVISLHRSTGREVHVQSVATRVCSGFRFLARSGRGNGGIMFDIPEAKR
jgi:hypothetical protein